jgi:hypothetical protein
MKYTLEIHHYYPATINSGHPRHDLRDVVVADSLWGLLRLSIERHYEAEFWCAINKMLRL